MTRLGPEANAALQALRERDDREKPGPQHAQDNWAAIRNRIAAADPDEFDLDDPPSPDGRSVSTAIAVVVAGLAAALLLGWWMGFSARGALNDDRATAEQALYGAAHDRDERAAQARTPAPPRQTIAPVPPEVTTAAPPPPAPTPIPTKPPRRRPEQSPSVVGQAADTDADGLRPELALVRRAASALRAGEPARALELTRQHGLRYPAGRFSDQATVIRAEALCASGRPAEARSLTRRFIRERPSSALIARMRSICAEADPPVLRPTTGDG